VFICDLLNKLFLSLSVRNGILGLLASYEIDTDVEGSRRDVTQELP